MNIPTEHKATIKTVAVDSHCINTITEYNTLVGKETYRNASESIESIPKNAATETYMVMVIYILEYLLFCKTKRISKWSLLHSVGRAN